MRAPLLLPVLTALLAGCAGSAAPPPAALPGPDTLRAGAAAAVRAAAVPLTGAPADHDRLLELVGGARVVLLGEATHGTHEFYRERARITERLVREKGFTDVAIEGDWPDAWRVDRYVRGRGADRDAARALAGFSSFPAWMWRNAEVRDFVERLRAHNLALRAGARRVGFHGLDVYSLTPSADAVAAYLEGVDPAAARRARERYACFRRFRDDPQGYGQAVEYGDARSCEAEAAEQLREVAALPAGAGGADERFGAERNARVVAGAEAYYRGMFRPGFSTWNLRDRHMAETLEALLGRTGPDGRPARVVVWAHNSHVGDARASHVGEAGEVSLGQLARERWGADAVLVGFTTYEGTVVAAREWGGAAERREVRPALPGSYEAVFHETGLPAFLLPLRGGGAAAEALRPVRLERAIGVVYLPQTERQSHYFHARLPERFDAVLHFDRTRAVEPLRP